MEDNNGQLPEQQVSSLEESSMVKNDASAMGKQALKDAANIATKELRSKVKAIVTKYAVSVAIIIAKILLVVFAFLLICGAIEYLIEKFEAKEAPTMFMEALGVEDGDSTKLVSEFIQIKKDDEGDGYHFEFVDDFDEKVKKAAEYVGGRYGNLNDPVLWKQFLMVDFATQLPNLGGSGQVISSTVGVSSSNGKGFWWPIGSKETTVKNGKTFASGEPEIPHGTNVIRGGVSQGWSSETHYKTSGEALDIGGNNQIGYYNVISMASGVVERADDGYPNTGPNSDNGGMGNCVYVRYPGNILVRYMHLSQGTVAVKVGEQVEYGQVLGKMGHSGESYSPHLHIDMWIGSENGSGGQDISAYMDPNNPRPTGVSNVVSSLDGFLFIGDSITVGLKSDGKVDGNNLTFVGSTGSTPKQWLENTKPASGEETFSALPEDSEKIKGISIMLGTNEVSQYEQYKELIIKLHEKYPNKPIYVQKIFDQLQYYKEIELYNSRMQQFCNEVDYATFIDATKDVEISNDGIHPTSKGYKTLAKNIKEAITSIKNNGNTSIYLKPEDEPETTDEITEDEEDFINEAPKEFQGTIKLKRITPNKKVGALEQNAGVITSELKYVEPATFEEYLNSGDVKALSTFTLSEDYSEVITAKWSYDGSLKIESNSGIDYRNLTSSYAMPYEYPMLFHVTGKDALFSQRLMYLVLGSSADVVLVDNVTTTQTKTTTIQTTTTKGKPNSPSTTAQAVTGVTYSYKEDVYTSTELGAVNSWWSKRTSTFNINSNFNSSYGSGATTQQNTDKAVITTENQTEETIASYNITASNTDFESNHEPFATIYNGSRSKANTQENWLLEFMGENDRTANMVEVTKYMLYKATGVDYGITEFGDITFGSFADLSYGIGSADILFDYIASWENGPLYSYLNGDASYNSSVYINKCISEDKKYYYCVEDIGMNNGTRNFGFGVCHYYGGHYNNVGYYQDEGIDITQYYNEGTKLNVEIVDNVKKRIIQDKRNEIQNLTQGLNLNDAQIDALVAVSYQYGNIGNFVSAYSSYGNTESLKNNFYVYGGSGIHPFSSGVESNGRAQSNWQLFNTGKYKTGIGTELKPTDYTVASSGGNTSNPYYNINLYNKDGTVNKSAIEQLEGKETAFILAGDGYRNGLGFNQCTWWANGRASQYLSQFGTKYKKYPTTSGNGGDYWQNNINGGWFKYGTTPKPNSLLCYAASSTMSGWGHVTYVEAVDNINKKIYISHSSSGVRWNGIDELDWSGVLWGDRPQGYIYLDEPL